MGNGEIEKGMGNRENRQNGEIRENRKGGENGGKKVGRDQLPIWVIFGDAWIDQDFLKIFGEVEEN